MKQETNTAATTLEQVNAMPAATWGWLKMNQTKLELSDELVTAPAEADLRDPKLGPVIDKYLRGVNSVSTENRLRILRLIQNLSLGTAAVGYRTESMHGAGSPQAQRIMISRQGNLVQKKALAKAIAHIKE